MAPKKSKKASKSKPKAKARKPRKKAAPKKPRLTPVEKKIVEHIEPVIEKDIKEEIGGLKKLSLIHI